MNKRSLISNLDSGSIPLQIPFLIDYYVRVKESAIYSRDWNLTFRVARCPERIANNCIQLAVPADRAVHWRLLIRFRFARNNEAEATAMAVAGGWRTARRDSISRAEAAERAGVTSGI